MNVKQPEYLKLQSILSLQLHIKVNQLEAHINVYNYGSIIEQIDAERESRVQT